MLFSSFIASGNNYHDGIAIYWNNGKVTSYRAKEYWTYFNKDHQFTGYSVYDEHAEDLSGDLKKVAESHCIKDDTKICFADHSTSSYYDDYIDDYRQLYNKIINDGHCAAFNYHQEKSPGLDYWWYYVTVNKDEVNCIVFY